ncbi:FadR/GntR family transcriptional regulator [Ornithinicoccus halotolerans]|uniref:FadR/GntR family transcriptional regulator n=1 Tax=Ornithinicoccus halotolerans TaxID=1748220 RepID=UPI001E58B697|nr:FCD domain-containing protein [Ornithinicoccus halotolerans]
MASDSRLLADVAPVRSGNVFEETMEHLLRLLRLGQFPPGTRMPPERELAEALGVSRTTLREALAELQQAGYVQARRGRYGGTYVAPVLPAPQAPEVPTLDAAEVEDVLTLRAVVEPAAARLAAERLPRAKQLARVQEAHEQLVGVPVEAYRPLDSRFHLEVARLSGTPSLVAVVADVRNQVNRLLDRIPLLPPNLDHSTQQHAALLEALEQGDPVAAEAVITDHLQGTAALLRGFLT